MMIAGRVIVGLAIGTLSTIVPMFISELAPKSLRGSLGTMFQFSITLGILIAFLVTYAFNTNSSNDSTGWRYSLGIQAAFSIALGLAMIFLPESPRWLIEKNREEQARKVLMKTRCVKHLY